MCPSFCRLTVRVSYIARREAWVDAKAIFAVYVFSCEIREASVDSIGLSVAVVEVLELYVGYLYSSGFDVDAFLASSCFLRCKMISFWAALSFEWILVYTRACSKKES